MKRNKSLCADYFMYKKLKRDQFNPPTTQNVQTWSTNPHFIENMQFCSTRSRIINTCLTQRPSDSWRMWLSADQKFNCSQMLLLSNNHARWMSTTQNTKLDASDKTGLETWGQQTVRPPIKTNWVNVHVRQLNIHCIEKLLMKAKTVRNLNFINLKVLSLCLASMFIIGVNL